jgi:hypothetical protein
MERNQPANRIANSPNRPSPHVRGTSSALPSQTRLHTAAPAVQCAPKTVQGRIAGTSAHPQQTKNSFVKPTMAAPPVYRPQMAVQGKQAAPPVYRPQMAAQGKLVVSPASSQQASRPLARPAQAAPPVYRPQMAVQGKLAVSPAGSQQASRSLARPGQAAPPVYRPQIAVQGRMAISPAGPQQNSRSLARPGLTAPLVYRPQQPSTPGLPVCHHQNGNLPVCRRMAQAPPYRAKSTLQPRMVAASQTIQMGHDKNSKAFTPMDIQNANFSTVTALLWIDADGDDQWECHGKFTSDNKGHAEEHIIDYLSNDVYFGGYPTAKVVIELTASPCGEDSKNCTKQLIDFKNSTAEERGIAEVSVKALGFYKGSQESIYNATEMISNDVPFQIWDVDTEMKEGTSEGYDNSKTMENFALAEVYQVPKGGRKMSVFDKSKLNQEKFDKFLGFQ